MFDKEKGMELELIADYGCTLGENPLWHPGEQQLYWTDIETGRLFRYAPGTGRHEQFYAGDAVGGFTFETNGGLLLFGHGGVIRHWRDGILMPLMTVPGEEGMRFNDVIADPAGRVFCGSLSTGSGPDGKLYRLAADGTASVVLEGIGCSNGLGFTADRRTLYYTDSRAQTIFQYPYDEGTGEIGAESVFVRIREEGVVPDGMTVDAEGYVWSALWGGWGVVRYAPDGTEERRIHVPARFVTSVAFGGADFSEMYITTFGGGTDRTENGSGAGAVFRTRPGVRGMPEYFSCLT